jgi:DNA polymerase-3 subunit alpha
MDLIWLDVETTGLDSIKNDVIQLACVPSINGTISAKTFNQFCQPTDWSSIDSQALRVNNLTIGDLKKFQTADKLVNSLIYFLKQFNTKFTIAGYNCDFDRNFIASLFKKVGKEREFAELFSSDIRDLYKRAKLLKSQLPTQNLKLATLCGHFEIPINAHDALSDILATIKLDKVFAEMLGDGQEFVDLSKRVIDKLNLPEPSQLHIHSMYSHTDSVMDIEEIVGWCLRNNVPGFSTVDHGNTASVFFSSKVDSYIKEYNKTNKTSYPVDAVASIPGSGLLIKSDSDVFYLNAWAVSNKGYSNLLKLSSMGWKTTASISDVVFPTLSLEQVADNKEGIIFGVPGINGPITKKLIAHDNLSAEKLIQELNSKLDIRLELAAVDVSHYYDSQIGFRNYSVGNMQQTINRFYFDVAKKLNIKLVPVSDGHYADKSDKIIQDCISKNSYKDSRYFYEHRKFITADEMFAVLKDHVGPTLSRDVFIEMVGNTHEITNLAKNIKPSFDYHLPKIEIPSEIVEKTDNYDMQTYYLTLKKIKEHDRWNDSPEYIARFKKEMDVLMNNSKINFLPYFLVYEDICSYVRNSGMLQNIARGSAGGSLISYYLKIVHVDPIAANLPFERFLSHARINAGSFPDIDLDIADKARPFVIKYLQDKYNLGFAQIATFNKMKTKNAIKDAMWAVYGRNRNDPEVKAICDSIPDSPQGVDEQDFLYGYTDQEGEYHAGQIESNDMLRAFFQQRPEIETIVKRLLGSIRGWSRHASAFVISTLPLSEDRVPTMQMEDKDLGSITVTQYDANMVEKSGLVKADILGIKTLATTTECIDLIKTNHNVDFLQEEKGMPFVYRLPEDDAVFVDFYNKDTDSSFQFNTELIKGYIQDFCPTKKKHLADLTALCRPGALDAPLYDTTAAQYYLDVRNGKREVEYLHSDLEPILKESNAVFIFQEEIMRFLVEIVGYSWEESDIIRSAIAKKKHEVIMNTFSRVRESCSKRGWTHSAIETICQQIMAFSRYSFNKSHSHAYGELGYITMYLKHYYPLEWWCSVLNNEDSEDKLRKYVSKLGDTISPPDLKNPSAKFVIKNNKIIAPISTIKSVGPISVQEIVEKGPFASLDDFVTRINHTKVNIGTITALIKGRAADSLMDSSIESYAERRVAFMKKYCRLRKKSRVEFKPEMYEVDDMSIFLQERESNQCFNRGLLNDSNIRNILLQRWPALKNTGRSGVPLMMGDTPVLNNIKIAEGLLKKGHEKEIGMILLFDHSEFIQGVSKKTGKHWSKVSISLSDGFNSIECADWNRKAALGWKKDTIVYVRGTLKPGWKSPVSLTICEIEKVESVHLKKDVNKKLEEREQLYG